MSGGGFDHPAGWQKFRHGNEALSTVEILLLVLVILLVAVAAFVVVRRRQRAGGVLATKAKR